ncbi:unnamed protein product [Soboliphyme baturini]|uniref:PA14 domain-containing protein n=1 Tax=Soboliphyme baturini TaxID=241478 RepID=A0A183IUP8_9BILA|nr:unnamed protein product [Soboliphyme baturini]
MCYFRSNPNFDYKSVMWKTGIITCPSNTTKITIRAENYGTMTAAVYIDDIDLVEESNDPDEPYVSYCVPNVQRF